jgi:hypothetical protein
MCHMLWVKVHRLIFRIVLRPKTFNRKGRKENPQRTQRNVKQKGGLLRPLPIAQLLRCQFLGLAFGTHEFERALGLFVRLRDFLLHLGGGLFHFWR